MNRAPLYITVTMSPDQCEKTPWLQPNGEPVKDSKGRTLTHRFVTTDWKTCWCERCGIKGEYRNGGWKGEV